MSRRAPLVIPILIMVVGVGWLLTARGFGPGVNWVWTLGLGVIGIQTVSLFEQLTEFGVFTTWRIASLMVSGDGGS